MDYRLEIGFLLLLQISVSILVFRYCWKGDRFSAGFPLVFIIVTILYSWIPTFTYLLPWYEVADIYTLVQLRVSTLSFIFFVIGCIVLSQYVVKKNPFVLNNSPIHRPANRYLLRIYILTGTSLWFILSPIIHGIPTATALVSSGKFLVISAVYLVYFKYILKRRIATSNVFLGTISIFAPLIVVFSILTEGFVGYGITLLVIILTFASKFIYPKRKLIIPSIIFIYLGLTFYQTYMRDRPEIRTLVWGDAPYSERIFQLWATFTDIEWFDPLDVDHLDMINNRLGQKSLFGRVIINLQEGRVPYAYGKTFLDAIKALVPRVLWSGKPVYVGDTRTVSFYTGLDFPEGTSVGLGPSFEVYVNFGIVGLMFWKVLIGIIVGIIDYMLWVCLISGDFRKFVLWFMPGLAILQTGTLVEMFSSTGAALVLAYLVSKYPVKYYVLLPTFLILYFVLSITKTHVLPELTPYMNFLILLCTIVVLFLLINKYLLSAFRWKMEGRR